MSKMIEKRRMDFLPKDRYDRLEKDVRDKLLSYQRLYTKIVKKDGMIKRLKQKIKDENMLLVEMKKDLTSRNEWIDHLRKYYSFSCSVVSLPPRKSGKVYYNLSISRGGITKPKNVSLGSEKILTNHLKEYYKGRRNKLKELKDDWKQFVWEETNSWEIYEKILDMILNNPLGFSEEWISRDTLFPLETKKVKNGLHTDYWDNGEKEEEGTMKDGKREGKWTTWSPNGKESSTLIYKDGEFWDGLYIFWLMNGNKRREITYKNGKQNGLCIQFRKDGTKQSQGILRDDVWIGKWTWWYKNGKKKKEGTYKGKDKIGLPILHGKWTEWYSDGKKKKEVTYKDGEKITKKG